MKKEANRPIFGQIPSDLLFCRIKGGIIKADVDDNQPTIKMTATDNKIRLDLIKPKNSQKIFLPKPVIIIEN